MKENLIGLGVGVLTIGVLVPITVFLYISYGISRAFVLALLRCGVVPPPKIKLIHEYENYNSSFLLG